MKQTLKWAGLVLAAAAVGLTFAFVFTASLRAQTPAAVAQGIVAPTAFPPGILTATPKSALAQGVATPTTASPRSWGNGRGSGYGPGWMGGYGHMGGMMGGYGGWAYSNGTPLTLDQAVEAANQYLAAYGNPDPSTPARPAAPGRAVSGQVLALTEVMEFSENFYAEVKEESSGIHAFELLIDRYTGAVFPEPGPNMMWNSKYGHMGRMWGGWDNGQADPMPVTPDQTLEIAQGWLDQYLPGASAAEKADTFYGYYTIHTLEDGQVVGMLSVNGYTGEVWYHTWHGDYITMKELED